MKRADVANLVVQMWCCLGKKGGEIARLRAQGVSCCDAELKYALRATEILSNWYNQGDVVCQGKKPYYVFNYIPLTFPDDYTLSVTDGRDGVIILLNQSVRTIFGIAAYINSHTATTGFSADIANGNLWIYAPDGYNGIRPFGTLINAATANNTVITKFGFQGGCKEVIAGEPCLSESQVQVIYEDLKRICSLCCVQDNMKKINTNVS